VLEHRSGKARLRDVEPPGAVPPSTP
jgi:hypothetical protein